MLAPGENGGPGLLSFSDALHMTGGTFDVLFGNTARGIGYIRADTDQPFEELVLRALRQGGFVR